MKRSSMSLIAAIGVVGMTMSACGGSKPAAPTSPIQDQTSAPAPSPTPEPVAKSVLVADWASSERKNALGGDFGAWENKGKCVDEIVMGAGADGSGAWRINYDITIPGSFVGGWMKLANYDASAAKSLVIVVKGEGDFSPDFIVELKAGEGKSGRCVLKGVTKSYSTVTLPLSEFAGLMEFKPLSELAIVFDEQTCPVKKGTYLIDTIEFQ